MFAIVRGKWGMPVKAAKFLLNSLHRRHILANSANLVPIPDQAGIFHLCIRIRICQHGALFNVKVKERFLISIALVHNRFP